MAIRFLYEDKIRNFLENKFEIIRDKLTNDYHGAEQTATRDAWSAEIEILQKILIPWKDSNGQIIFEYDIPRL